MLGVTLTTCIAYWAMQWSGQRSSVKARLCNTGVSPVPFPTIGTGETPVLQGRSRNSTYLKWIVGVFLALAVVAPWLIMIERRLPGYTLRTLRTQVVDRAATAQEGHKGPPGYYFLLVWATYFPWSLLLPATIVHAWRRRHLPAIRFGAGGDRRGLDHVRAGRDEIAALHAADVSVPGVSHRGHARAGGEESASPCHPPRIYQHRRRLGPAQ